MTSDISKKITDAIQRRWSKIVYTPAARRLMEINAAFYEIENILSEAEFNKMDLEKENADLKERNAKLHEILKEITKIINDDTNRNIYRTIYGNAPIIEVGPTIGNDSIINNRINGSW